MNSAADATPTDPPEIKWAYIARELRARGFTQRKIDEIAEEEAWRIIRTTPPNRSNGHAPEQPRADSSEHQADIKELFHFEPNGGGDNTSEKGDFNAQRSKSHRDGA